MEVVMDISRKLFVSCIFALLFFSFSSANAVEFLSYDDALSIARDEGKNVYVLFGGENCPWCHKQKDVIVMPSVAEALDDYVVCHVDISERKDLASRYRVRTIPASFVIDKDEKIEKRAVGYMDATKFMFWLR